MLLILTHENADFDAVAAQMAAHKLYPEGTPLLSWRINRNVMQFLTLYWNAFNFVRPADWKRQRISKVVLVDTQALPSIRGMRPDRVEVKVIDHHEVADGRNDGWAYHIEPVGATTTILVEKLQAAGLNLSANEATLLLLGIHEDTGSLVYDTTTVRDAQAAAWLMKQGAQLSIMRRFLNISLSDQQQLLFERLQESAVWNNVEGQAVVVAAIEAPPGFKDEISAVAHRFRDAFTPDGMYLLVQLKHNHVQLVARSGSDNVDVLVIARALGGGGHSRAAAATVMDQGLAEVRQRVMELLPKSVRPMTKVSQIMSYGVQTLPATATVVEAAEQMQRSGHEGYPVIDPESRKLVGLLTRRIVDRSLSHQLVDLKVSQVMKAGRVTVRPSDSVEQVQRLMIQEGWGQIPVVTDEGDVKDSERLVGIVTRTDLINLLTENVQADDVPDMRRLMAASLPPAVWGMVQEVGNVAHEMEMPLYFVGGLVRDLLLGKSPADIDMVVEGDAIDLVRRLRTEYGGEIRSHRQFGTAKWLISPEVWRKMVPRVAVNDLPYAVDFVTARTEFYTMPTALPEVERGSIKLDLHRRDFTVNTLAVRLDGAHLGELLDFYGGRRDLESGLVRVLHSLSFLDDPTRILRAARLEQRLGFRIEARTAELIADALPMLNRVTGDRIRNELELCLKEESRELILDRLAHLGVLAQIHPGLTWQKQTIDAFHRGERVLKDPLWADVLGEDSPAFVYFALLLLALPATVQGEIMTRLKVRRATCDDIVAVGSLLSDLAKVPADARPSLVWEVLQPYPARVLLVALAVVGPDTDLGRQIDRYQRDWRMVRTALNGNDLLEIGLQSGPQIGRLLQRLLAARLDGEVSDEVGERALLTELMSARADEESP